MSDRGLVLSRVTAVASALFALGLGVLASRSSSEMAFAQASDSLLDVVGAVVLSFAVVVGQTPRDAGHPMGHTRAEALGALGIAGLSTLLSFEVGKSAISALLTGARPELGASLLALFVGKGLVKAVVFGLSRRSKSPALRALSVDARNDVGVALVAVLGFLAARYRAPVLDAWLALPLAAWIGWSGISLARENVDLLMGGAPSEVRQAELLALARGIQGVVRADELRAQFLGHSLAVQIEVQVAPALSVRQGYELAERVRLLLESEADVLSASVLIAPVDSSPAEPAPADSSPAEGAPTQAATRASGARPRAEGTS